MTAITRVLAFDDERAPAATLAGALGVPLALIERHRFPDGELKLRLPPALHGTVVLWRSLHQPNEKLVELMIAAPAARELGAGRLVLVCPYLAYMRQDIAFTPGEAVSQRHIGRLLAQHFEVNPNEMLAVAGYDPIALFDLSLADPDEFPPEVKALAGALTEIPDVEKRRQLCTLLGALVDLLAGEDE